MPRERPKVRALIAAKARVAPAFEWRRSYADRSFTFITKTPPASVLLKRAAGVEKGSGVPHKNKVGKVTMQQVREIAQLKTPDLTASSLEAAIRTIEGTARSMGLVVEG